MYKTKMQIPKTKDNATKQVGIAEAIIEKIV